MNGRYLLDTNIVISLLEGDETLIDRVRQAKAVFVASISIGELYFGAHKSVRVDENLGQVEKYVSENTILGVDTETARMYGSIKGRLRKIGRPIPENDIWIAAIARQYQLTLVTRDEHFGQVEDLLTARW
jgi:tRNA(fMet)-specific endonuclease VapC